MKVVKGSIREAGVLELFDSGEFELSIGEFIVVEREKGCTLARVMSQPFEYRGEGKNEEGLKCRDASQGSDDIAGITDDGVVETIPQAFIESKVILKVIRKATEDDINKAKENKKYERVAYEEGKRLIVMKNLDMKLIDTEVYLDRSKLIFYFTSEHRVDFRDLVRELAKRFKTRIEMKQVGVRDALRIAGAIGPCGYVSCCRRFLRCFESISVKMARDQNLLSNTQKLSGICGRLLCCLSYEHSCYLEMAKEFPGEGTTVMTPEGKGRIILHEFLSKKVIVKLDTGEEKKFELKTLTIS